MSSFLTALGFLTIFPSGRGRVCGPEQMASSMAFFPLVGILLGAVLVGLDFALGKVLPGPVVAALILGFLALASGGLHLDGFADTLDGIFSGRADRARILEIMKDSRVGAMGVIGLVLLLLVKFEAMANLHGIPRWQALFMMPTVSRWSQVQISFGSKAARAEGSLAGPFLEYLRPGHMVVAAVIAVAAAVAVSGVMGLIPLAAAGVATVAAKAYFNRKLGGITGDTIGAVSEFNEVLVLLVFLASAGLLAKG